MFWPFGRVSVSRPSESNTFILLWVFKTKSFSPTNIHKSRKEMIGIASNITALLTAKPSKQTIIALALLGAFLALTLISGVYAGRPVDAIG